MAVLPAPALPARKTFKHPFLVRVSYALAWGLGSAASVLALEYSFFINPAMIPLALFIVTGGLAFALMFGFVYYIDYTTPTVTLEEMWYRKRLEMALTRDNRVAQLNADHDLLTAAADALYEKVGREASANLKNSDVVDYAIELARTK